MIRWKKFAYRLGNFQAQVIFTLFYFIILFPVAIFVRFTTDHLNIKTKKRITNFAPWDYPNEDLEMAKKPY